MALLLIAPYTNLSNQIDVGENPAVVEGNIRAYNVGMVPAGCTIILSSLNGNGSILPSTYNQTYDPVTSVDVEPPVTSSLLYGAKDEVNNGVVSNTPHVVTTGTYLIFVMRPITFGPTSGVVIVKVSYLCP